MNADREENDRFRPTWDLRDADRAPVPEGFSVYAEDALLWHNGLCVGIAHAGARRWIVVNSDAQRSLVDGERRWTTRWVCAEVTIDEAAAIRRRRGIDAVGAAIARRLWTRRPVLVVEMGEGDAGDPPQAWLVSSRRLRDQLPVLADPKRPGQWTPRTRRLRQRSLKRAKAAREREIIRRATYRGQDQRRAHQRRVRGPA